MAGLQHHGLAPQAPQPLLSYYQCRPSAESNLKNTARGERPGRLSLAAVRVRLASGRFLPSLPGDSNQCRTNNFGRRGGWATSLARKRPASPARPMTCWRGPIPSVFFASRRRPATIASGSSWTGGETITILNRYPYNNGHLLVAPRGTSPDWMSWARNCSWSCRRRSRGWRACWKSCSNPRGSTSA